MNFVQYIRSWPWWAISLSLGINLLFLVAALFAIAWFRDRLPLVVISLLSLYILLLQPLKDWLISRMALEIRQVAQIGFTSFDNRVARIMHLKDILEFLGWLIRAWKLTRLRLVIFDETDYVYFFSRNKRIRRMRFKDELSEKFKEELAALKGATPASSLSPSLKAYLLSRKVKFVVPVLFRDRLIGLLGFNELLNRSRLALLDHAAHRIGLALENEQLERTVPRSEFLSREFRLAEKIERHLSGMTRHVAGNFQVQKLETAWDKKHFSAIFGHAKSQAKNQEVHFLLLVRLSVASTRSNALQLFATQGYFYALAAGACDVRDLQAQLHRNLRVNENRAIMLEGFLIALLPAENKIDLLAFGRHLAYRDETGWSWIRETPPLGAEDFEQGEFIELKASKEVIVSMREYPLLMISGGRN